MCIYDHECFVAFRRHLFGKRRSTAVAMSQLIMCAGMVYFLLVTNAIIGIEIVSDIV
jgi:hypothetical protein